MSDTPKVDAVLEDGFERGNFIEFARTLERELAFAREGLNAVSALIDESQGVGGLHMNGDFAPWSELRTGGRFETWLAQFDASLNAARSSNKVLSNPEK